jgi:hypothetical protein
VDAHPDRRQSPRVVAEPPLPTHVVGLDANLTITELSFGGFRVEGPVAFVDDADYEFLVSAPDGAGVVRLSAKAVHCRVRRRAPSPVFETGFVVSEVAGHRAGPGVTALIESLTSVLQFQ